MKARTETTEWTTYEMSYREFCEKLGIPPGMSVVTVSANAYSGKVEIKAVPRK